MNLFLQLGHLHSLLCPKRPELGAVTAQQPPGPQAMGYASLGVLLLVSLHIF